MKNYFYKLTSLCFILIAMSFASCESDDSNSVDEENQVTTCTDNQIINYLSECNWFITDTNNAAVGDIAIDFSNNNIHAFNPQEEIVEEGNWDIQDGVLSFNNLSETLADYGGTWTVTDCLVNSLTLSNDNNQIVINSVCDQ